MRQQLPLQIPQLDLELSDENWREGWRNLKIVPVSGTKDTRVLRKAPLCSLLQGNMHLLCFHKHYTFKAHRRILGQPGICLSISIWFWKFKSHKPIYSAFYTQCQQFLHISSRIPWALQALHTLRMHTGHAATAGVRTVAGTPNKLL